MTRDVQHWCCVCVLIWGCCCEERANAKREDWCYGDNEDLESGSKPFKTSHSQLINHPLDSRADTHTRTHISHGFIRVLCCYGALVGDKVHILPLVSNHLGGRFFLSLAKGSRQPRQLKEKDKVSQNSTDDGQQSQNPLVLPIVCHRAVWDYARTIRVSQMSSSSRTILLIPSLSHLDLFDMLRNEWLYLLGLATQMEFLFNSILSLNAQDH